jgi:uncharacterized protein (DUF58 family)
VVSFFIDALYPICWYIFMAIHLFVLIDIILLFAQKKGFEGQRKLPEKLSNGDDNSITLILKNNYAFKVNCEIIDEIPFQFQERNFFIEHHLKANKVSQVTYTLKPFERGEYYFGFLNVLITSPIRLMIRKYAFDRQAMVPTYPSFMQLKKYELMAFSNFLFTYGIKKIRRLGHTMEFEQIKEYVLGDDMRTINWKATAKKNQLMINQHQDEKSQAIYMIIDKGRVMKMPFNGLSLLDYAINATLVLSNIIIRKHDKAGMFTFSKKVENRIAAEKRSIQMQLILENLYNINTNFFESDFSRLYVDIKKNIPNRSLLLLYTNFETLDALKRQLNYLKAIAKNHLLVVIFFENTELKCLTEKKAEKVQDIFDKTIAEKFQFEKKLIAQELRKYGIFTLLTAPENLTLDSINTYLEIKARGMI